MILFLTEIFHREILHKQTVFVLIYLFVNMFIMLMDQVNKHLSDCAEVMFN